MNKKVYIAAALTMVAVVGCQKEFAPVTGSEQTNGAGLELRPEIGSVAMTFEAPDTKVERDGTVSWKFKDGDQVGAMLVDKVEDPEDGIKGYVQYASEQYSWHYSDYVKGPHAYSVNGVSKNFLFTETYMTQTYSGPTAKLHTSQEWYKIDPEFVYSNYPYTGNSNANGRNFTTPAKLVEGHYVFYAPYNGNGTRGPLVVTLPTKQDVSYDGETLSNGTKVSRKAIDDFFAGSDPVLASVKFLSTENTSNVESQLEPIFAYPRFTIKNDFEGFLFDGTTVADLKLGNSTSLEASRYISTAKASKYTMTVKQVELYVDDEEGTQFAYKQALNPDGLYSATYSPEKVEARWSVAKTDKVYQTAATSAVLDAQSVYNTLENPAFQNDKDKNNFVEYEGQAPMMKEEKRIVLTFGDEGYTLAPGESYSFNVVMPAEDYTTDGLYARVLVSIDGKDYYILTNDNTVTQGKYTKPTAAVYKLNTEDDALEGFASTSATAGIYNKILTKEITNYRFIDRDEHGAAEQAGDHSALILVRGEQFPVSEVNTDRTMGVKSFAGNMLTINLVGGDYQIAVAKAVKKEDKVKGIKTFKDFTDFLDAAHQNATALEETTDPTKADYTHFYLDEECELVINADLVKELVGRVGKAPKIVFSTNLPIANDVIVEETTKKGEYTFFVDKDKKQGYNVSYSNTGKLDAVSANALGNGIQYVTISEDTELKAANTTTGTVVFVHSSAVNSKAIVKAKSNISGIVLTTYAKESNDMTVFLKVSCETDAWVVAPAYNNFRTVTVDNGGSLTNALNDMAKVENTGLGVINGKAADVNVTVQNLNISAIAKDTKINRITIAPDVATSATAPFIITADAIKVFANLTDGVNIDLGANLTDLSSPESLTMTNVKTMTATKNATWRTPSGNKITVTFPKGATWEKITGSTYVEIINANN